MVDVMSQPPAYTSGVTKPTDPNWNNIPVITINSTRETEQDELVKLPKLPSDRFRYTLWHELRDNDLKGSDLNCPRVRRAPEVKDRVFRRVKDEQGRAIHHGKTGHERKLHERQSEDWENAQHANLCFQDLHHDYQKENFHRILKKLIRAETIQIRDNNITNLSDVTFNCCKQLNLSKNFINSFKKLPKCPMLEVLNLSDNPINSFENINVLSRTKLESLDLSRSPICFMENYRQRIFHALPNLKVLDGIPRLSGDSADGMTFSDGGCIIL